VVLAVPRCAIAVLQQDATYGGAVPADHAVIAGIAGGCLRDQTEADRVVIASRDQRRTCRRTQRRRVEVGVAQASVSNAVERRRRDHAAKGGRRGKADIIGHDEQFGAPCGGTTRAGHAGVDCAAFSSMLPLND
jgi:hypothetical protein